MKLKAECLKHECIFLKDLNGYIQVGTCCAGHVTFLLQGRAPPSLIHGRPAPAPWGGQTFFAPQREPRGLSPTFSRSRRDIWMFCWSFVRASTLFRDLRTFLHQAMLRTIDSHSDVSFLFILFHTPFHTSFVFVLI